MAVPWTAVALAVGLLWSAVAVVLPSVAAAAVPVLDWVAAPYGWPAAGPPQAWGTVALAASPFACLLGAAALAYVLARPRRVTAWAGALIVAILVVGWGSPRPAPPTRGNAVELTLLDVGQGDSILLRDGRHAVLVDGGGWRRGDFGVRVLLPALLGEGVSGLDVAVLTHPDVDHCGGLLDLASYLPIGELWTAEGQAGSACGDALRAAIHPHPLAVGTVLEVGLWTFEALHPPPRPPHTGSDNDLSLVLAAEALGRRVLLTGDVEAAAERTLTPRLDHPFDILKVAHHGSKTSTTLSFLTAVHPRLALISAGPHNPYGHPAPLILARLSHAHTQILRTDLQGEVRLTWTQASPIHIELPGIPR